MLCRVRCSQHSQRLEFTFGPALPIRGWIGWSKQNVRSHLNLFCLIMGLLFVSHPWKGNLSSWERGGGWQNMGQRSPQEWTIENDSWSMQERIEIDNLRYKWIFQCAFVWEALHLNSCILLGQMKSWQENTNTKKLKLIIYSALVYYAICSIFKLVLQDSIDRYTFHLDSFEFKIAN